MKYQNAFNGLKKIYNSEILSLIAAALGAVASSFGGKASQEISGAGLTPGTAFGVMIPLMAAGILAIVAAVMELFGLKDAAEDDEYFKTGYTYALIGLVVSIAVSVLQYMKIGGGLLDDFGKLVSSFVQIAVTFYVISGIRNLAEKLGNAEMAGRGKKVFNIYAVTVILASVVTLLTTVLSGNIQTVVAGILAVVTLVLTVVGYVLYLRYLRNAKEMLG